MQQTVRRFWEDTARRNLDFATCGGASLLGDFYIEPDEIKDVRNGRVLDVGCGWGRILVPLARNAEAIGLDVSTVMAQQAKAYARRQHFDVSLVVGDAAHLPFRERSVDVLVSYLVFQHLSRENLLKAVSETARVLRQDGTLLGYLPNKFGLDGIGSTVLHDCFKRASYWGPAKVQYYHPCQVMRIFTRHFQSVCLYAKEFRIPWVLAGGRVLVPRVALPLLRRISDSLELMANSTRLPLKTLANGLAIKAERPLQSCGSASGF
jgi:ubiquinone/menaquinone biosynthesis C-methylase UbiE